MQPKNLETLQNGFDHIMQSPSDKGVLRLIVARPEVDRRTELDQGELDETEGLIGDNWAARGSSKTEDGSAHPEMQINIMNSRAIDLITQSKEDWETAGDQLFVDFNLSKNNVPPGTKLAVGDAILEVTSVPHTGCKKFAARFGVDAVKFISSPEGRQWQLRGINARVVKSGSIKIGDQFSKISG